MTSRREGGSHGGAAPLKAKLVLRLQMILLGEGCQLLPNNPFKHFTDDGDWEE